MYIGKGGRGERGGSVKIKSNLNIDSKFIKFLVLLVVHIDGVVGCLYCWCWLSIFFKLLVAYIVSVVGCL